MEPTIIQTYLAGRIIGEHLTYVQVITARPQDKAGIDYVLTERGYAHLIVEV
jgi:hypothetical protein